MAKYSLTHFLALGFMAYDDAKYDANLFSRHNCDASTKQT
jgi:hypothetical protein